MLTIRRGKVVRGMATTISTNTNEPTLNERIEGMLRDLLAVAQGSKSVLLAQDITGDWPEALAEDVDPVSVTPAQAGVALSRFHTSAVEHGSPKAAADLPSEPAFTLVETHTVVSGTYKGQKVNLWAQALKSLRRSQRKTAKQARAAHTIATKGGWTCAGVFVKGTTDLRVFPSQRKARNAGANLAYGSDWYETDKAIRQGEQEVTHHPVVTEQTTAPEPAPVTTAAAPVTTDRVSSLMGLTRAALVAQAKGMGQATSGTKAVLAARIDASLTTLGL